MVMHARKLPRINDGFSEKHQTHGYENSKYSNKYRYGNLEKNRDSPSTNSMRSSSPDSHSQSPRYHKNNYYKVREKERERENRDRDRERDYKDFRERDGSRSPKDRRREIRERDRERDHRDSRLHDRINSVHKKEEKERLMQVGDWSEHVSSSGKKYYYNCQSQVSQWEKPSEWYEWERTHRGGVGSSVPSSGNHSCKESSIHRSQLDKNRQDKHSTISDGYRDSRVLRDGGDRRDFRTDDHYDRRENRKYVQDVGTTDMDISSGDSTPTSESRCHGDATQDVGNNFPSSTSNLHSASHYARPKFSNLGPPPSASLPNSLPGSIMPSSIIVTSSNIGSYPINACGSNTMINSVPQSHSQYINPHPRLLSLSDALKGNSLLNNYSSQEGGNLNYSTNKLDPLILASNNIGAGPPTPTHSEAHDGLDLRKVGSPTSSLNSLQSLTKNSASSVSLTASLANYYKEHLCSHVMSWPADNLEKQCHRLSEEAHTLGSLIMTKVSAELKMARSLVRLAEIQATLHEQRILFLRAQKKELEDMKEQNCFLNDT